MQNKCGGFLEFKALDPKNRDTNQFIWYTVDHLNVYRLFRQISIEEIPEELKYIVLERYIDGYNKNSK